MNTDKYKALTVMAVDLGNPGAAVVLSDEAPGKPHLLHAVAWANKTGLELAQLIVALGREFEVELLATEKPWTGQQDHRRKVALGQSRKAGGIDIAAEALQVRVAEYTPRTIRAAFGVKAKGAAGKVQVARCVQLLVIVDNPRGPMTEHVADACAIGYLALMREKADRRLAGLGVKPQPRRARSRRRLPA